MARASAKSRASEALLWTLERREALSLTAARTARALGRPPTVELYFAFDDPYSAVALAPLRRVCRNYDAVLALFPLVKHGIENDPDLPLRNAYAVQDAARLLARRGAILTRVNPLQPDTTVFLAGWTAGAGERASDFAEAALDALWLAPHPTSPSPDAFAALYERIVGAPPPSHVSANDRRLASNHARLRRKGHWESPAALVAGSWFFAHERLEQIEERLARTRP